MYVHFHVRCTPLKGFIAMQTNDDIRRKIFSTWRSWLFFCRLYFRCSKYSKNGSVSCWLGREKNRKPPQCDSKSDLGHFTATVGGSGKGQSKYSQSCLQRSSSLWRENTDRKANFPEGNGLNPRVPCWEEAEESGDLVLPPQSAHSENWCREERGLDRRVCSRACVPMIGGVHCGALGGQRASWRVLARVGNGGELIWMVGSSPVRGSEKVNDGKRNTKLTS